MTAGFELAGQQLAAGTTLLEASAGTGKTEAITGLVLRLLLEDLVDELPQVLVVTFTVAATEELKTRLRRQLLAALAACEGAPADSPLLAALASRAGAAGAQKLRRALASADDLSVATIHGFCHRVLAEAAFESGVPFATALVDDELPLIADAARDAVRLLLVAGDATAAAVGRKAKLLPEQLAREYRQFRLHAGTRLLPSPPLLAPALAGLRDALAAARDRFDPGLGKVFAALQFKKNCASPVLDAGAAFAAELQQRLATPDHGGLDWLCALAPSFLRTQLLQRSVQPPPEQPFFAACERVRAALGPATLALRAELFATIDRRLADLKRQDGSVSFQDLLQRVHAVLHDPDRGQGLLQAIRARWRVALIDEFQDTDPLQYEIFATCFGDRRLFLVGDPKQSIYGFRGADVHAYLLARQDAGTRWTLDRNHRSHPGLVAAVAQLFGQPAAFALAGIALPAVTPARAAAERAILGEDRPPLQIRWLPPGPDDDSGQHNKDYSELRITTDVADECVRLLAGGLRITDDRGERPLTPSAIAVLTRTNAQAVAIQDELRQRRVKSAIGRAGDVFRCPELDEMLRLLAALARPTALPLLRGAWSTVLWGMDAPLLAQLDTDQERLALELARADALRRTWLRHGFVVMFQDLLRQVDARGRLLPRPEGERKLTNYLQIAELLHRAEHDRQLAPESLAQWLLHERAHAQEIDYQLRELRLESDAEAVQILTAHGSKGLQFPIVFVPFAWGFRDAPSSGPLLVRTADGPVYDYDDGTGRPAQREALRRATIAEDLRLLYVAMTRAGARCYLHWGPCKFAHKSALAFLLHGPGRDPAADPAQLPDHDVWSTATRASVPRWRRELDAIAAAAAGTIEIVDLPQRAPPEPRPQVAPGTGTECSRARPLPARVPAGYAIASFTSLVAHDRSGGERELDEPDAATPAAAATTVPASGLHAFARGARAGVCLHEILEHTDFAAAAAAGDPGTRQLVQRTLARHGLLAAAEHPSPIDPEAAVRELVHQLATARLGDLPFRLADLPAAARAPEWQFFLAAGELRPRDLAAVFEANADDERLHGYAERLRSLPARSLHGFLRGFVDLVVEHEGRYFVFDWKSNWLGPEAADYIEDRLAADMRDHDYVLQYHLYLLALDRHLRARLRGYDYDRHIGGACYVYLRGVAGGAGVFCARPAATTIAALERWLAGEGYR